jgi:hypothetical protein
MSTHLTHPRRALRLTFATLGAALIVAGLAACSPAPTQPRITLPSDPSVIIITDSTHTPDATSVNAALEEARARVPFAIQTPAWVPEGYHLSDEISVANDAGWVLLEWQADDGALVDLIISPVAPATPDAPPQFVREVAVGSHTGYFIFGLHNATADVWDPTVQTLLTWRDADLYYSLATAGLDTAPGDLQRMAESLS